MQYIGRLWEQLLYGDQPAGWFTIGTKENILSFERKHFIDYLKNQYSSKNTIVCISGNFDQKKAINAAEKAFKPINKAQTKDKIKTEESQGAPGALVHFKKTDQTHLCLGVMGYDLFHPKKYALNILSIILGGNMSSRLFSEIREKRGLAYYIRTESENYTDTGYLCTQAGIPNNAAEKVIGLTLKEYRTIRDKSISQAELKKAKDYLKGVLTLSLESSDSKASFYAAQELLTEEILTLKEKCAKIDKITTKDIRETANDIFCSEKLNLAIIGPHKSEENFKSLLKL
jgi:predicted Zn-dependent peptidase